MIRFLALLVLFPCALLSKAGAEAKSVVIELFASQNCAACPAAHRTMKKIAETERDVLVLTWSVDYWDYLGTPDPMAMEAAKLRQAAYTDRMAVRAPYTPQSVYDGVRQCPATRRDAVDSNIQLQRKARTTDAASFRQSGNVVEITGLTQAPVDILLVEYLRPDSHTTGMVNPVTRVEKLGTWQGGTKDVTTGCLEACAVLLQYPGDGEVLLAYEMN